MQPEKPGFILGGGGALGANSVGFLWAAEDYGILNPTYIQGSSVGGIIGAKLAEMGGTGSRVLRDIFLDVERRGPSALFPAYDPIWHWSSTHLFRNRGIRRLVDMIDAETLIRSPVHLDIVTIRDQTESHKYFTNRDPLFQDQPERIKDAILASASIPGFLPPIQIEDRFYSDGRHVSIQRAIDFGCDCIFIFFNGPRNRAKDAQPEFDSWQKRLFGMSTGDRVAIEELRRLRRAKSSKFVAFRSPWTTKTFAVMEWRACTDFERGELNKKGDIELAMEHAYECAMNVFRRKFPKEI
ncbi:MAG: patatin-like phospholipase family protein [Candidatus Niyogibacteria bacterium]|nr:patatin-like phospholipase family protein [Candidatus Niyogibacteria bacterium]